MRIREFTLDDYDAALALWSQYPDAIGIGASDSRPEIAKKVSADPELFLLAVDGERVIGSVIGGFDGRRGLIYHLAVDRSYRGQGLGRALMAEIERRLKLKGCLRAYLLVKPGNQQVVEFYGELGWEIMDVTTMAKNLAGNLTT